MKKFIKMVFAIFFFLTFVTLTSEILWLFYLKKELDKGYLGLPKNSYTYKLAEKNNDYVKSMQSGLKTRMLFVYERLLYFFMYLILGCAILIDFIRLRLFELSKKTINLYCKSFNNICKNQVALSNIFFFMFVVIYLYDYIAKYLFTKNMDKYVKFLVLLGLYSIVCPLFLIIVYFLLQQFGARLIIAVYISVFIKNIYEVFIQDDSNKNSLKPLDVEMFDSSVQNYLDKNNLSNNVYQDTTSKDTNAALVGLDKSARIEISGDFNSLDPEEKDSILLHEIGHSEDHSLLKKLLVFFVLIYLEMLIMLFLYNSVANHLKCENISQDTSFILLSIVYFLACSDWLMMFYKLSSQRAEIAADLLAKNQGFGKELASTLFNISINESSVIRPSWLYNSLVAMHPTIYDRVEYLSK